MLTGLTYARVCPKGRISVPAPLREALGARFTLTRGTRGVLVAVTIRRFAQLCLDYGEHPAVAGFVLGGAVEREWTEGRFSVPVALRRYAGLEAGALVAVSGVGAGVLVAREDRYQLVLDLWERCLLGVSRR